MKSNIPILLLCLFIILSVGCTPEPAEANEVVPTNPPATESSSIKFEMTDIPLARSFSMAVNSSGNFYVAYGQDHSLFVSRSADGGRTFSKAVLATGNISVHVLPIERPAIAVDNSDRVGIAWLELAHDYNGGNIWYAVSDDGGQTFKPAVLVAMEAVGEVAMVQVALDEAGNPLLTWLNGSKLKFTRSFDGGSSFSESMRIRGGSCECCQPQMFVTGENVNIAYRGLESGGAQVDIRDIVMIRSEDRGVTFQPITRVSDTHWSLPACPIAGPSLAVHNGNFYIAWMDGRFEPAGMFRRGDIWLASSQDGGQSFSPNIRINPDQEMHHTLPTIAIGPAGRIHVAWEAHPQGPGQILLYYTTSDDGGQTFAHPQVIANNTDLSRGNPGKPVLVADALGRVTLAWLDRSGARVAVWSDTR